MKKINVKEIVETLIDTLINAENIELKKINEKN